VSLKDKRTLQQFRVPLGFLFAAVFLVFARPIPLTLLVGAVFAVLGLLIRAWSSGHIRKNKTLAVSGPYAHTRNPLYVGSFIMGLGFTIASAVWWLVLIFIVLFLGIYLRVMRVESQELTALFGADYEKYSQNVPLFFPRLSAYKEQNSSDNKFDLGLYLKYREYRAALGVLMVWVILAGKLWWQN
jgi:protein-S-isoprenylcysteine O-methyltransferase Ste14